MCTEYTHIDCGAVRRHVTDPVGGVGCTRSESLKLSHQSPDRRSHCRGQSGWRYVSRRFAFTFLQVVSVLHNSNRWSTNGSSCCMQTYLSWAAWSLKSRPCCEWKPARNRLASVWGVAELGSLSPPGPERLGWGSRGEQKHTHTGLEVQ